MRRPCNVLRYNLKYIIYAIVLINISLCFAGSYEDFFTAIKRDDASSVSGLLNRGFDPNTLNPAGQHGLFLAVKEGSFKVVAVLLQSPTVNVESRTQQDESPLMLASLQGLTELCAQLIEKGADVNKPGWAPLHYAATKGHLAVMSLLLENHAYIDAASPNGSTPLMMAALYGTPAAVRLLLDAGADATLKNDQGLSAFDFAHRGQRLDSAEIIAAFIRGLKPKGTW